jgi:serine/threonine protein phosphatase PrpC
MVDCVRVSEDKPSESCARLIDRALLHASQDNVTALVLPLGSWGSGDGAARTTFLHDLGRGLSASARFG